MVSANVLPLPNEMSVDIYTKPQFNVQFFLLEGRKAIYILCYYAYLLYAT